MVAKGRKRMAPERQHVLWLGAERVEDIKGLASDPHVFGLANQLRPKVGASTRAREYSGQVQLWEAMNAGERRRQRASAPGRCSIRGTGGCQ